MPYRYRGARVWVPEYAEVSSAFLPHGVFSSVIQEVLDSVEPWEKGDDPIEPFDFPRQIGSRVVLLTATEKPVWGVNPHHKARTPGLSPYIGLDAKDERNNTKLGTLELTGTVNKPVLTRVYPGDYMPPLPWMSSVSKGEGGREASLAFWNQHAFVIRTYGMPEELTEAPPDWYAREAGQPQPPSGNLPPE